MIEVIRHTSGYSGSPQQSSKLDPTLFMDTSPVFPQSIYTATPSNRSVEMMVATADALRQLPSTSTEHDSKVKVKRSSKKDKPGSMSPFEFVVQSMRSFRNIGRLEPSGWTFFGEAHHIGFCFLVCRYLLHSIIFMLKADCDNTWHFELTLSPFPHLLPGQLLRSFLPYLGRLCNSLFVIEVCDSLTSELHRINFYKAKLKILFYHNEFLGCAAVQHIWHTWSELYALILSEERYFTDLQRISFDSSLAWMGGHQGNLLFLVISQNYRKFSLPWVCFHSWLWFT